MNIAYAHPKDLNKTFPSDTPDRALEDLMAGEDPDDHEDDWTKVAMAAPHADDL